MKRDDRGDWAALWREALRATSLGWDLALPIFGGVLLGHFLDRWLETGYVFPLGMLERGIGVGFYNVARAIRRIAERSRRCAAPEEGENRADE